MGTKKSPTIWVLTNPQGRTSIATVWEPLPRNPKHVGANFPGGAGLERLKESESFPEGQAKLEGNIPGIPGVCAP